MISNYRFGADCLFHYLKFQRTKRDPNFKFHVINRTSGYPEESNPLNRRYLKPVACFWKTAEAIFQSLQKSDSFGGADQVFRTISNQLSFGCISLCPGIRMREYSTSCHVLDFLNRDYEDIFNCWRNIQKTQINGFPFRSAYEEGLIAAGKVQVGYLKIFLSRL